MSKKILVTDHDPSSTRLTEYILKQRGYQVLTAQNGLEGLRKAQNEDPDLVILDVMLPGMDGFEVCHRLRAERKTAQLPVLMLSGRAQEIDRATAFKMGADDYIAKPATPTDIINRIESLLARRSAAGSRIISFISPQVKVGTTTAMVNVAIALSQMDKRVIAVDLCSYDGSMSQQLGLKPEDSLSLPEASIDSLKPEDLEGALVVHQTGVKILRILETPARTESILPSTIDLLFDKLGEVTDYCLVDLPFQPTAPTRMVLARCDLAIIVGDHTIEALADIKSVVTVLNFLGVSSERIGAVIVDLRGTFPDMARIKPYVEANLGITLLGTIPYNIKPPVESSSDSLPLIMSSPDCSTAGWAKELAQQIISRAQTHKYASRTVAKKA